MIEDTFNEAISCNWRGSVEKKIEDLVNAREHIVDEIQGNKRRNEELEKDITLVDKILKENRGLLKYLTGKGEK